MSTEHQRAGWREANKRYRIRHRERWLANSKKSCKKWYAKNKEYSSAYMKDYHERNREKRLAYLKEWRKRNPDKRIDRLLALSAKIRSNPEKMRMVWKAKAARRKERGGHPITVALAQLVYERNIRTYGSLTCYLCKQKIDFGCDVLEHKTPLCRGGDNDFFNLDVAHFLCNARKRNKTVQEFLAIKGGN